MRVMKGSKWTKRLLPVMGMGVLMGAMMVAQAAVPDEIWEFEQGYDDDDNILYEFPELELTIPGDWEDRYDVEETEDGLRFYASQVREDLGFEGSGELFVLSCREDYSFMNEPDYFRIIGSSDTGVYYMSMLQGDPNSGASEEALSEWQDMSGDFDWIVDQAVVTEPGEGVVNTDEILGENSDSVVSSSSEYILADSSSKKLTAQDLAGMSADELQMAINEIYARHGRKFVTKSIQDYFNAKSWYKGTVEAAKFDPASLNQYENENIALMLSSMSKAGSSSSTGGSGSTAGNGSTMYATVTVNVRSKASTSGSIMGVVPQGSSVTVTGSATGGWVPVNYNGIRGYISQQYLTSKGSSAGTGSSSNNTSTESGSGTSTGQSTAHITLYDEDLNGIILVQGADGNWYSLDGELFGEVDLSDTSATVYDVEGNPYYWNITLAKEATNPVSEDEDPASYVNDPYDLYTWDAVSNAYIPYQQADSAGDPVGRGNGWYYYDSQQGAYLPW